MITTIIILANAYWQQWVQNIKNIPTGHPTTSYRQIVREISANESDTYTVVVNPTPVPLGDLQVLGNDIKRRFGPIVDILAPNIRRKDIMLQNVGTIFANIATNIMVNHNITYGQEWGKMLTWFLFLYMITINNHDNPTMSPVSDDKWGVEIYRVFEYFLTRPMGTTSILYYLSSIDSSQQKNLSKNMTQARLLSDAMKAHNAKLPSNESRQPLEVDCKMIILLLIQTLSMLMYSPTDAQDIDEKLHKMIGQNQILLSPLSGSVPDLIIRLLQHNQKYAINVPDSCYMNIQGILANCHEDESTLNEAPIIMGVLLLLLLL